MTGDNDAESVPLDEFTGQLQAVERLLSDNPDSVDKFLAKLGGEFAEAEHSIVVEMAYSRVIGRPSQFREANQRAIKGIEVLYRNGRRVAPVKGWGPFKHVAHAFQMIVTSFITRGHVHRVVQKMLELYTARENLATTGSPEWSLIFGARRSLEKLDDRYRRDRFGMPLFLFSSAVFAAVASGLAELSRRAFTSDVLIVVFAALMFLALLAVGTAIVQAAGVSKRRIAMTTEQPMATLYRVVGGAGRPPRDFAWIWAATAILSLMLIWIVIPGSLLGVLFN